MIPALGAGGPGFESRFGPLHYFAQNPFPREMYLRKWWYNNSSSA